MYCLIAFKRQDEAKFEGMGNELIGAAQKHGGSMSHPVIVAREYGIPCVAGCIEATKKIETGNRLRIDGDLGVVYTLGE